MRELGVRPFRDADTKAWDCFVANSWNGTFLHTRRFLSYHGSRFQDMSLVIEAGDGKILGVLPAAADHSNSASVISHPGITYGGVIHSGGIRGETMTNAFRQIMRFYRSIGFQEVRYKAVPHVFQRYPCEDDLYSLFRLGARRYRCDLNSVIDLSQRAASSKGNRLNLKNAQRNKIRVMKGREHLASFWPILTSMLHDKHKAVPVHSLAEIEDLSARFPEDIECIVGAVEDIVRAGIVTFRTPKALHLQYSAADPAGQAASATTLLLEETIADATRRHFRYFSFGISTEDEGQILNQGLYQFKGGFGAGSFLHEFYQLSIGREDS